MVGWNARTAVLGLILGLGLIAGAAKAGTLETVRERGSLLCGTNTGLAGFAEVDDEGNWRGFDIEFCRALAVAVLGEGAQIVFTPLNTAERFTAVQSGEVDVLARNSTWTFSRDAKLGLDFGGVYFYDGQGFIVPRALGVSSVEELDGARICLQTGTTTELNVADYFRTRGLTFDSIVIRTVDEARTNYLAEACDAYTTDLSALAALRTTFADADQHVILPETISKEPLGPAVREGDDQWADIVRWTLNVLFLAEELGVTAADASAMRESATNPEIRRLLGVEGDLGAQLGLDRDWAFRIITTTGHYGELFERTLGAGGVLKLDRGLNRSWQEGGLFYAPPLR